MAERTLRVVVEGPSGPVEDRITVLVDGAAVPARVVPLGDEGGTPAYLGESVFDR